MIDDFLFSLAGRWPNRQLSVPRRIEFRNKRNGAGKKRTRRGDGERQNGGNEKDVEMKMAEADIDRLRFLLIIVFGARLCV
jgi:hypothetical protein